MLTNKRYLFVIAIVILAGLLSMPSVAYGSVQSSEKSQGIRRINAGYIELTEEHRTSSAGVRAFIPTDSSSPICLVTLAEASFPVPGMTVFCGNRVVDGVDGVIITIFYAVDLPDEFVVTLTVYQDDAKRYGEPVLYIGD
jgi:hypothetical protein